MIFPVAVGVKLTADGARLAYVQRRGDGGKVGSTVIGFGETGRGGDVGNGDRLIAIIDQKSRLVRAGGADGLRGKRQLGRGEEQ